MTELWKDIEGYEGYQVSNLGRVRSTDHVDYSKGYKRTFKSKIRKQQIGTNGYLLVPINNLPNIPVHRAVAKAFVPGYFEGAQVNHKDENRQNNRWDNLEWVTPMENANYGSRNRKCRETKEKLYGQPVEQYTAEGVLIAEYPSKNAAARAMKCSLWYIQRVLDTHRTINGYSFKSKTN